MAHQEDSLFSNLSQCLTALRRVKASYIMAHPLIKSDLQTMDDRLSYCVSLCASTDDKSLTFYPYCFSILYDLESNYHRRLTKYFNNSPYWQHYVTNTKETIESLAMSCRCIMTKENLDENGNEIERKFSRKFVPMVDVMRRKWSKQDGRLWIDNTFGKRANA